MKALIKRDLLLAFRSGGGFGLVLGFYLIFVLFIPFGLGADLQLLSRIAAGVIWVGALLANLLTLERIFQHDWEDGTLASLTSAPIPFEAIALAKIIAHWLTTGLPLVLAALPMAYLLNLAPDDYLPLLLGLLIGSPALSAIGAFGASLTMGIKRGGLLLSLLVLPLYTPSLLIGAQVTLAPEPASLLALLGAISLGSIALLPFAMAFSLRANLT